MSQAGASYRRRKIGCSRQMMNPAMSSPQAAKNAILCDHSIHLGVSSLAAAMTPSITSEKRASRKP